MIDEEPIGEIAEFVVGQMKAALVVLILTPVITILMQLFLVIVIIKVAQAALIRVLVILHQEQLLTMELVHMTA